MNGSMSLQVRGEKRERGKELHPSLVGTGNIRRGSVGTIQKKKVTWGEIEKTWWV